MDEEGDDDGGQAQQQVARRASISFAELRAHRRLAFAAHGHRLPSTEYLEAGNSWQAESYSALLEMTRAGLGWTTLPRQSILREIESGELVELPLQAYPHTDWVVGVDLLWSRQAQLGQASLWLRHYLQQFKVFEMDR
ncbi:LysR substrate-binding domain-containing protein, partial [Alcaligenes sp. Marseille-Q7550]